MKILAIRRDVTCTISEAHRMVEEARRVAEEVGGTTATDMELIGEWSDLWLNSFSGWAGPFWTAVPAIGKVAIWHAGGECAIYAGKGAILRLCVTIVGPEGINHET